MLHDISHVRHAADRAHEDGRRRPPLAWAALGLSGAAAYLLTAALLHANGVGVDELVRDTLFVSLGLLVPGVVLWRMLGLGRFSLLEDAVLGTSLAYAAGLACYLLLAALRVPQLIVLWPLLPLLASLLPRVRKRVWRRAPTSLPTWYGVACSALVAATSVLLCQGTWTGLPLSGRGVRSLYLDLPYHLALIEGVGRSVPHDLLFLKGEPLYYHWFVHAQMAAESHMTGIDPFVLLTRLSVLPMALVTVVGSGLIARRLSGSAVAGLVAPLLLLMGHAANVWPVVSLPTVGDRMYLSPTMTFADVLLIAFAALSVRLLQPGPVPRTIWPALVLVTGALSGAKGPALPVLMGAWLLVVVVRLITERRLHRRAALALLITVSWLVVAQVLVYGLSPQGTTIDPLYTAARFASQYGVVPTPEAAGPLLRVATAVLLVVVGQTAVAGQVALVVVRWHDPRVVLLAGWVLAGFSAFLLLAVGTGYNQLYFLLITPVALVIGSAWGAAELWRRARPRPALIAGGLGALAGFLLGARLDGRPLPAEGPRVQTSGPVRFRELLVEPAMVAAIVVVAVVVLLVLGRRRPSWRGTAPVAAVAVLIGSCLPYGALHLARAVADPGVELRPRTGVLEAPTIGRGGLEAARWLRSHSDRDALVATNAHCRLAPRPGRPCDRRTTWIAGFSDRQVLVEGWSYTSQSAQRAEAAGVSLSVVPFWRPRLLAENDAAIASPTRARLERLHREQGVDWLFVDERFPHDLPALRRLADVRFETGRYAVVRIG